MSVGEVQHAGAAGGGGDFDYGVDEQADMPGNQAFVRNFIDKYDSEPSVFSALAYTSVQLLVNAISEAGSTIPTRYGRRWLPQAALTPFLEASRMTPSATPFTIPSSWLCATAAFQPF